MRATLNNAQDIRDAGSLPADVRSRKTGSGYPHEECTAMRAYA